MKKIFEKIMGSYSDRELKRIIPIVDTIESYEEKMKDRVYEIYLNIVDEMLKPHRGAIECLQRLRGQGIPLALASSADHIKIDANLRVAGIQRDTFNVILGAEDVVEKKPAPDIYLKATKSLGFDPINCIVVEDAVNGIQSAHAAGIRCIGVTTTFDRDMLERSISHALRKRPVEPERIDRMVNGIVRRLESTGESDIPSDLIGELVMEGLGAIDQVAYVRFASVYKNFHEAKDFERFVEDLEGPVDD